MKRFIRDHVRYVDEIQCAAARVVRALRQRVKDRGTDDDFDTIHIRRGDFQYKDTRVEAPAIVGMLSRKLKDNATLFIATDERDKKFFGPIQERYDVLFLDDFMSELEGINSNYFGMIDQLISSRGRLFYGCWFSTFTGYINRLRGYHADDHQTPGFEDGIIPSYHYAMEDRFDHMQTFYPVKKSFYAREFPTSWRLIDADLKELRDDRPTVDKARAHLQPQKEKENEKSKDGGVEPHTEIIKHVGLGNPHASRIAGLNCDKYSGPSAEDAQEMVYWEDIPSDSEWISPFHSKHRNGPPQYLTFEPDLGGWNNIR
jgi:hypothetical protein